MTTSFGLVLSAVFFAAAVSKLRNPDVPATGLADSLALQKRQAMYLVHVVAVLEMMIALQLLLGLGGPRTYAMVLIILLVFTTYLLSLGAITPSPRCGCLSSAGNHVSVEVARNIVLMALAIACGIFYEREGQLPTPVQLIFSVALLAGLAFVYRTAQDVMKVIDGA